MATTQIQATIKGTLRPDGTIELSERPDLPAGPVEVTIRLVPAGGEKATETLLEFIRRTRAELEASGHRFRTAEEIDAYMAEERDWDGRLEEIYRQIEEARRRENPDVC